MLRSQRVVAAVVAAVTLTVVPAVTPAAASPTRVTIVESTRTTTSLVVSYSPAAKVLTLSGKAAGARVTVTITGALNGRLTVPVQKGRWKARMSGARPGAIVTITAKNAHGSATEQVALTKSGLGTVVTPTPPPLAPAPAGVGDPGTHAFAAATTTGAPAHWDRCTVIPYYVNPAGMPAEADAVLAQALDRLTVASGLQFRYAGPTDVMPYQDVSGDSLIDGALTVGFADLSTWTQFAGTSTLGQGGLRADGSGHALAGGLILNTGPGLPVTLAPEPSLGRVMIHELGHAVNLDHVNDPTQVMYPQMTPNGPVDYQNGDVAGMRELAAFPCQPVIQAR